MLEWMLTENGIITAGDHITDFDQLEFTFKNLWADHADAIANQYTGTGALKTDFTRTGKRTKMGLIQVSYD